jgi:hypothetical protein
MQKQYAELYEISFKQHLQEIGLNSKQNARSFIATMRGKACFLESKNRYNDV